MKEFASFERVLVREGSNLETLQEHLYNTRRKMDEQTENQGLSSQEGQLYLSFFSAQSSRIRYQEDLVKKVRREVEQKRKEMSFAVRRRKIFQNLKEKHIEAEDRRSLSIEMRKMDEIAGIRFAARTRGDDASG